MLEDAALIAQIVLEMALLMHILTFKIDKLVCWSELVKYSVLKV